MTLPKGITPRTVLSLVETERQAIIYAFEQYPKVPTKYIAAKLHVPVSTLYVLLQRHGLQHLKGRSNVSRKVLGLLTLLLATACAGPSGPVATTDEVYVIGDSISIGYQPFIANSVHSPGNASSSIYTHENIDTWLVGKLYRSIVFNNGLHDIVFTHTSLPAYRAHMEAIADVVLHHTANPVFVLSTHTLEPGDFNDQVRALNAIATEVMTARHIPVVDLYTLSETQAATHYDEIHFNATGYQALAAAITPELR